MLLFAFTSFLRTTAFNFPYERDEGGYAYVAYFARQGIIPYRDVFDQKPPLIYLIFYLGEIINPGGTWGPRVLAATFTYASAILIYFVGKKEFDRKTGLVSMWLFVAMLTIPEMTPFSANTEIFLLPFMIGGYLIFVNYGNSNKKLPWFIFGVLSSIAVLFKPICTPLLLYIFILWVCKHSAKNHNVRQLLIRISLTILGTVIVITPIFLYLVKNNALKPFIDTVILYNLQYSRQFQNGGLLRFYKVIIGLLGIFPLVFLTIFIYFFINRRHLWLYLGTLFFLFLPVYNTPILHYYLITIPFLALFSSAAFNHLLNNYNIKGGFSRLYLTGFFVFSVMAANFYSLTSKEMLLQRTYLPNPFSSSKIFADILKNNTENNDEILMLGNEPQVLYYSKRISASRFFYLYPILIPTAEAKVYREEYINDLQLKQPKHIVYSPFPISDTVQGDGVSSFFAKINKIIQEKYEIVGGCASDKDCGWTENVNANNTNRYSFILYRKRV